jgi:hypothetical protein
MYKLFIQDLLDKCTNLCKGKDDIVCLQQCGAEFKSGYHKDMTELFKNI